MIKSKIKLCSPNTIIKFLINFKSHFPGLVNCALSTLSDAIVKNGRSLIRLFNNICFGSIGKKGRKKDAAAMLNILPKVAPVDIKIYFIELTKDFLPSRIPSANTERSFSNKTKSAASLATSTAFSVEMPISAALMASASLIPSPI